MAVPLSMFSTSQGTRFPASSLFPRSGRTFTVSPGLIGLPYKRIASGLLCSKTRPYSLERANLPIASASCGSPSATALSMSACAVSAASTMLASIPPSSRVPSDSTADGKQLDTASASAGCFVGCHAFCVVGCLWGLWKADGPSAGGFRSGYRYWCAVFWCCSVGLLVLFSFRPGLDVSCSRDCV